MKFNTSLEEYTLFGKIVLVPLQIILVGICLILFTIGFFIEEGIEALCYKAVR